MSSLLDTHAFLWFVLNDPKLPPQQRSLIEEIDDSVFLSPASYWEIAIKISCGLYALERSFDTFWHGALEDNEILTLPIEVRHARTVSQLPFHHKDPFDRMLVAQTLADDLPMISNDTRLDAYGVRRLW